MRFCWALPCVAFSVLLAVASAWFLAFIFLYMATFLTWSGWRSRRKGLRLQAEVDWWSKAKDGEEQDPLDPCCVRFGETGIRHDEMKCTRYRYKRPKPITREERLEIDRQWNEIIARFDDSEHGEEA